MILKGLTRCQPFSVCDAGRTVIASPLRQYNMGRVGEHRKSVQSEHDLCDSFPGCCFEYAVKALRLLAVTHLIFIEIDKEIRLDKNLIVNAVDSAEGVVMAHEVRDPFGVIFVEAGF